MTSQELLAAVDHAIDTYEEIVGEYASRTRQMIERHGVVEALSRVVQNPDLQSGFKALRDQGELDVSFESVVVNFSREFKADVVAAAQWRLDNADDLF